MISNNKKCPCCKPCKDPDFHKIANLKNIGLQIYSLHDKDVKNKQECFQKPSCSKLDVIIVHNKTNVDITADKYLSELDKYSSCPRCKYKFEHAKQLLAKIPRIEKLDTVTICDHCQAKIKKPCQECSEIVNSFIVSKLQKKKLLKEVLLWLSNVEDILEQNEKLSPLYHPTGSQLHSQIGQLLEFETSTQSTVNSSKIQFSTTTEIIKGPLSSKSESALLHVQDKRIEYNNKPTPLTFYHSYEHLGKPKSISKPFQQSNELEQHAYASKNLKLQVSLEKVPRSFKISEHTYDDYKKINKDERPRILLQQTDLKSILSKSSLRKGTIQTSLSTQHSEEPLRKVFSYYFIKETSKDLRPITKRKSSAELIRDIQEKLDIKLELKQKENEERRLKIVEEGKKKRLLKAELEKKKLQQLESDKKNKKEKRSLDEDLKEGKIIKNKIEAVPLIVKPSDKDTDDENRKKITDIPEVKESSRVQKGKTGKEGKMQAKEDRKLKEKQENEDKMRAEKEKKVKEKIEREEIQAKKEQKLRVKQEKEEKNSDKERKLKEKEEREKLKKEKEEKVRNEKEKKQRIYEVDEEKNGKEYTDKNGTNIQELKRMLLEQAKKKEKESKIKSQQEETKKKIAVEHKPNEDIQDAKIKSKTTKEPSIKIRSPSPDDLILQLVKIKQTDSDRLKKPRPKCFTPLNIPSIVITAHKGHKNKKEPECIICNDSELELDIENIVLNNTKSDKINDIIIGENILKCKPYIENEMETIGIAPLFFRSTFKDDDIVNFPKQEIPEYITETKESKPYPILKSKYVSSFSINVCEFNNNNESEIYIITVLHYNKTGIMCRIKHTALR